MPNRRQTISWTNVDPDFCHHFASPGVRIIHTLRPGAHFINNVLPAIQIRMKNYIFLSGVETAPGFNELTIFDNALSLPQGFLDLVVARVGVDSIISTPTPTQTPEVSTPTPANRQNINSNSNSNSGGFNSNSNSNSGKSPEYQLQLRRFQLQLQFQLWKFQLQLQLRSFKSNPNSISNPINLVQLNYHYQITMWNIVWIKWRYAVDICHVVPNLDQTGQHWHSRW